MQGCTLSRTQAERENGTTCLGPLNGRTGELPTDHGLDSSGRGTCAGRSRGQLAPPSDASRPTICDFAQKTLYIDKLTLLL